MKRKLTALLIALMLLLSAAGCATTVVYTSGEEPGETLTLTDMSGRTIAMEEPASRIVALTAADCEIICALGAGDLLVGRGEYCDYPEEVLSVPSVQSGNETNLEEIIALDPDVLFMGTMAQTDEQVERLEAAGIQVVVSDAQDLEGVYTAIRMIGKALGKDTEAEELVASMQETFLRVQEKAAGKGGSTVYFEVSPLQWGLWAAGSGTFMNEIADMLGMKNIFADVVQWAAVSEEQVIERNPDYIVTITMYFGEGPTPVEEILGRSGWAGITAVKNGAILNLAGNELSRPGPRLALGAEMLCDFVYGD